MFKQITLLSVLILLGCSQYSKSNLNQQIGEKLKETNYLSINFAQVGDSRWSRVCFLGPYSQTTKEVLGFEWDLQKHTSIVESDSINVIILANMNQVLDFVEYPRLPADFSMLSGKCYPREQSHLVWNSNLRKWTNSISNNEKLK